jgi:Amt family ammonium transporter
MKSIGILALLAGAMLVSAGASAQELNGADTAWILTSTALVLFMTIPGLSLFYAGLVRSKNVLSVLMQCFALTCLMSLVWFALGYTIAFGSDADEKLMRRMAEMGGGQYRRADETDIEDLYKIISTYF